MASQRFQKGSREFEMFSEFWSLCQKYWIPEESDEYWESAIRDIGAFQKKYGLHGFARKLGGALAEELGGRYKADENVNCEKK